MFRKCVFIFILATMLFLSSCKPANPPVGQPLSIAKQVKTEAYKTYEPTTLNWRSLIPEDYTLEYQYQSLYPWMSETEATETSDELLVSTPVVESLNQTDIRLAGYVVPLASDAESISEFLLVPIEGACLHVPAPPANQVVHVKPQYPLLMDESFGIVNVVGTLTSQGVSGPLAAASYSIDQAVLEPYNEKDAVAVTGRGTHAERGRN